MALGVTQVKNGQLQPKNNVIIKTIVMMESFICLSMISLNILLLWVLPN